MPDATFTADLRGVHYDFLKQRVPSWFLDGTTQRQEELGQHEMDIPSWYLAATHQDKTTLAEQHTRFRETLNSIEEHLGQIDDILAFAEQPLKDAIKKQFNLELDVRNVFLVRKYAYKGARDDFYGAFVFEQQNDPSLTYTYRGTSLLEAALANFEADEEQPSPCTDCQLITRWNPENPHIIATFAAVSADAVAIKPHEFAKLCRSLDLGAQYQKHIKVVVEPDAAQEREALEQLLEEHQRQQLALSIEIARLQLNGALSADAYQMLKQVVAGSGTPKLTGKPVTYAALKVLDSVLVGPLLIGPDRERSDRTERLVVYIPGDPQQPVKEYASSGEFMVDLRMRLHSASYRRFFSRFVPVREQGDFFARFNRLYQPADNGNGGTDYPLRTPLVHLPMDGFLLSGDLWQLSRQAHISKILSDARAVAVPTEDEGRKARLERLESFFDAAVSVFNLAAFVVPGLGPIMLAVGASQMCYEVFEGIEAYGQGEPRQMWAHFASVALNVAFIATGAKVLPAVKWQSAVEHLKPVTMPSGKQVLWNPDLAPYESPVKPAPEAKANALGLYEHDGQQLVAFEDAHYQVKQDPLTGDYRIQHPTRSGAYTPELEHNHNGVWSHELEEPLTWDEPTLLKRLGLGDQADPLRISGVDTDVLRQAAVHHEPLPWLLEDTLKRFELHQQLTTFAERIRSSDPLVYSKAEPKLQFDLLQRRGLLPDNVALKVIGPRGEVLWETPDAPASASKRVMVVTESAMARGGLLRELLYTLQGVDPLLKAFPGSPEESLEVRAGKLRHYLGDAVDSLKGPLLEQRYQALNPAADADVQRLLDAYPALPTPVAERVLQQATTDQLQAFRSTRRLPEPLATQARWCAQETRVARAYEGLHLDTQAHLDSQRLALRTLETLPGWHRGSRIELRQYSAEGTVLDAIGSPDFAHKRTLVLLESGDFQASMPGDFYSAIWEQLALAERQRLGLNSAVELKQAIQRSPLPREPLRTVLEENPLRKPDYDPMARLLGGAPGVRQLLRTAGNVLRSPAERVRRLFPTFSDEQVTAFIESLGEDVRGELSRRELEYRTLKKTLKVWAQARGPQALNPHSVEWRVSEEIKRCWRRETGSQLHIRVPRDSFYRVDIPAIKGGFDHVRELVLSNVTWGGDSTALFLENFTELNSLSITGAEMTELPAVIGDMKQLTSLKLNANGLQLTEHSAGLLSDLNALQVLDLSSNPLGVTPDFSGMPHLRELNLYWTRIERWPSGLREQAGLERLDLRQNRLQQVPQDNLVPPADQLETVVRINNVTLLENNRFPPDYWKTFDKYWQDLARSRPDLLQGALEGAFDSKNPRIDKVQYMYPEYSVQKARALIWSWGEGAEAQLNRLWQEHSVLLKQLNEWAFSGGGERQRYVRVGERANDAGSLRDRREAWDRILRCWRQETPQQLTNDGEPFGLELNLSDLNLPSLPDLDADFSHVGSLNLSNMNLRTSPEGFLARFRGLRWLDLSNNQLRELPPAVGQMHGLTRLSLQNNRIRLTADSAAILSSRISAYGDRLSATERAANRLVASVTSAVDGPVVLHGADAPFRRWSTGSSTEQLAQRRLQWSTLRALPGSDGFFEVLRDLEIAPAGREDLQRRIWEVIDGITQNSNESEQLRKEMFEWAGRAACCDRAALTFSNLEILLTTYNAKALALDSTQGAALLKLSKGLFRLDELEKIALEDIDQRRAAINVREGLTPAQRESALRAVEEVEVRMAYRHGLKDRLELPGQPQQARFVQFGNVSQAMLDAACQRVLSLDNSSQELQAMLARDFWKDYVANKYRTQFEAQNEPHHEQMEALQRDFDAGTLPRATYDTKVKALQAQFEIEEAQLIERLSRDEVVQALVPTASLEVLVDSDGNGLQLSQAQAVDFNGKRYFVASMPDAGDGEHYVLWVQAADNPLRLTSSAIVAKPDVNGVWRRRGLAGGMVQPGSDDEFVDASESMPVKPYTAAELSYMRREVHFAANPNPVGSYIRANNGKYPLRDYQGRPIRIRTLQRQVALESDTQYTSAQVKPYIQFEGYEHVGARYEAQLQLRTFTAQDVKVPGEKALIGQSMVVANRRIAKGEIVGVYGGTVLPSGIFGQGGQTYTMKVGSQRVAEGNVLKEVPIHLSGDNILSRINTHFEYDENGKPLRQAPGGYNVETVGFDVEADMWLGVGPGAQIKRKPFILNTLFAIEDIAAGTELRMDYQYTEGMIKRLFA
ncbi:dermonecrotic toxin domain-containing protein [Pseudomonas sp. LG1E9]|uniref:dermonecrotic toxin domain-containing protein n=1 Tax=Pseudomonas sp. LG1E9 TaxID=2219057 RepID=UPI000DD49FAA|nr:DUF6543 domain-containing protein [Pseudomonas sp. LG1E9]